MSTTLQHRRGSAVDHASFTGSVGEVTYDTTDKRLVAHDGSTAGGVPVAKESEVTTVSNDLSTLDGRVTTLEGASGLLDKGHRIVPHEALYIKYVTAATVDIDATAVYLFDTNSIAKKFSTLNETLNITASGANGLDTGSEASSTWYHIWAIGKSDGTLDGLLSTSATSPTMPAGYDYKGYLGAVYNDGSSNFMTFYQDGNVVSGDYVDRAALSGGSATSYTSVSLSALVPSTTMKVHLTVAIADSGGILRSGYLSDSGSGTTGGYCTRRFSNGATTGTYFHPFVSLVLSTAQTMKYYVTTGTAVAYIYVCGWEY